MRNDERDVRTRKSTFQREKASSVNNKYELFKEFDSIIGAGL
jgi:hypothetical protein